MRLTLLAGLLFLACIASAQKREEGFDYAFRPTQNVPRYFVITEKKDSLWHRQAWYLPERGAYLDAWYKDEKAEIPHGPYVSYHRNRQLKATGRYVNGLIEGPWLEYSEEGYLSDSGNYVAGKLKGARVRWYDDGMPYDSVYADGQGNGTVVTWHTNGQLASTGNYTSDTVRLGRWTYYHTNGKIRATEDYSAGTRTAFHCFDESGKPSDTAQCATREASFTGGKDNWIRYIQRNLKADVAVKKGAPLGQYTVVVQFVVDTDGQVINIKPITAFGYGMEEEVVRLMQKSPRWQPAWIYGTKVKAYRKQPITFVVEKG